MTPLPGQVMRDVFISYASNDAELARQLRVALERAGHSCWMAPDDIRGPKTYAEQIIEAISTSRAMIVIISDGANASDHVPREVSLASDGDTPILPVRVENVLPAGSLQYLLQLRQWVDAFPGAIDDHIEALGTAVDAVLQQGVETSGIDAGETTGTAAAAPRVEYLEVLSKDASATVWRARDSLLGRDIAVRELRVPDGIPPERLTLQWAWIEEQVAKATCLRHPSLGEVYGAWRADGRFMISAELLEGETLEAKLSLGPLAPKAALALLLQMASAISYAHRKGAVHAGVRPWNAYISAEGQVRLSGGGMSFSAGAAAEGRDGGRAAVDPMGSAGYLAPEQLEGGLPTERSDQFALAVVAHEMLTGRNPFGADADVGEDEVVRRTLSEPLPLLASSAIDFPQAVAVDAVLARASSKDPRDRYPSVAEFWTALRDAWRASPVMPVAPAAATVIAAAVAPESASAVPVAPEPAPSPPAPEPAVAAHIATTPAAEAVPLEPLPAEAVVVVASAQPASSEQAVEPAAQEAAGDTVVGPAVRPAAPRRRRVGLIVAVSVVVAVGLLAAGYLAFGGGGGDRAPVTATLDETPAGPTADELMGSAVEALATGEYSVATSAAVAAAKMDTALEETAAALVAEADRRAEIAEVEPVAETAFKNRKWSEAVTAYARLVSLDPQNAAFKERLGQAKRQVELARLYALGRKYERAHSWSKAKRAYERVVALDKKYRDAAKRLARVRAALDPPKSSGGSAGGSSGGGSSGGGSGSGGSGGGEEF